MKKKFILFCLLAFSLKFSEAQWTTSGSNIYYNISGGNVGIGTASPAATLDVLYSSSLSSGQTRCSNFTSIQTAAFSGSVIGNGGTARATHSTGDVVQCIGNGGTAENNGTGNVVNLKGLQGVAWISGSGTVTNMIGVSAGCAITGTGTATNGYGMYVNTFPSGITNKWGVYVVDATAKNYFSGAVTVGTTSDFGYMLAVNGKAIFTEAKVKLYTGWPDYVFDKDHKLLSLGQLEKYLQQNNHLPDIPSANEIKEQGGFELGDMTTKLLAKVEELTLYVIQLKKENDEIKKQLKKCNPRRNQVK
jgi:hypothetical protein